MPKYINPENIKLTSMPWYDGDNDILVPLIDVKKAIAQAPTEDVIAVVRCKDCTYRKTPECAMWYQCMDCGGQWSWETEDGFCSYGERMEK